MYDSQVWRLVDQIFGIKIVGCELILKKKTNIDMNAHTFKPR